MDLKLSISILDSELISPIYHYQVPVTSLIKDVVAKNIHQLIDEEIHKVNDERVEAGHQLVHGALLDAVRRMSHREPLQMPSEPSGHES